MKMKKKKKMNLLKLPPSSTKRNDRMNVKWKEFLFIQKILDYIIY